MERLSCFRLQDLDVASLDDDSRLRYPPTFQDYTTYIGVTFVQYGTPLHTPRTFTLVAKTTMPTLVSHGVSLLYLPTTHLLGYNTSSRPYDIPSRLMVVLQIALGVARSSQFLCDLSSVVRRVVA